eukprot:397333_1
MASWCSSGQQAFIGGYVLLGCLFTLSVVHESTKLVHRYRNSNTFNTTPKYLLSITLFFIWISMLSLIKCIVYGLLQCHYITISRLLANSLLDEVFDYLYVTQLYFLWIVLLLRLNFTMQRTPFQPIYFTVICYVLVLILYPLLFFLLLSPSMHNIFVVSSFSLSIFITLSIMILYGFKAAQIHRGYNYQQTTKQCKKYIKIHSLDPLELIRKNTILVFVCTISSFVMLFALITLFTLDVYHLSIPGQRQLLDLCSLFHPYITSICVLLQFKYLHPNYLFRCHCVDVCFEFCCNKYLGHEVPTITGIDIDDHVTVELKAVLDPPTRAHHEMKEEEEEHPQEEKERVFSDSNSSETMSSPLPNSMSPAPPNSNKLNHHNPPQAQTVTVQHIRNGEDSKMRSGALSISNKLASHPSQTQTTNASYKSVEALVLDIEESMKMDLSGWVNESGLQEVLIRRGFPKEYVRRAIYVYEKHYGSTDYDLNIIGEIIYRLQVKDRIKQLKSVQSLYESPDIVRRILSELGFSDRYINLALMLYEVTTEMFDIAQDYHQHYDLELIAEIAMRLRAKFTEYGDLKELLNDNVSSSEYKLQEQIQTPEVDMDDADAMLLSKTSNPFTTEYDSTSDREEEETRLFEAQMNALRLDDGGGDDGRERRRQLIATEREYIEDLHVLLDEFINPMFDDKLIDPMYRAQLTCNIPKLIGFHERFYQELVTNGSIAAVFAKESDYLREYIWYISSYQNRLNTLGKVSANNAQLNEFVRMKREREKKTLIWYLMVPMRRMKRYELLLSQMEEATAARDKVKLICASIAELQQEIENMSRSTLISWKLRGLSKCGNIVQPQRKYMNRFIFKHAATQIMTQFFVFNDIVITADMKWRAQQIVTLWDFDAQKPNKNEVNIEINDETAQLFVSITDNDDEISNVDLFVSTITKYRTLLYQIRISRAKLLESQLLTFKLPQHQDIITPSEHGSLSMQSSADSTSYIIEREYKRIIRKTKSDQMQQLSAPTESHRQSHTKTKSADATAPKSKLFQMLELNMQPSQEFSEI